MLTKILHAIVTHYIEARLRIGVRVQKLLHDNVPAHKSVIVSESLKKTVNFATPGL